MVGFFLTDGGILVALDFVACCMQFVLTILVVWSPHFTLVTTVSGDLLTMFEFEIEMLFGSTISSFR